MNGLCVRTDEGQSPSTSSRNFSSASVDGDFIRRTRSTPTSGIRVEDPGEWESDGDGD